MTQFPETRESLLIQVRDPQNRAAWERFVSLYRPVVYRLARQRGLQDADADDLSQQVLISVAKAIPQWEETRQGRFRYWLRTVVRNAIINQLTRGPRDRAAGGSSMLNLIRGKSDHRNDESLEREIDHEFRRELYLQAAELIKTDIQPATWQAFELTVINQEPIEDAARTLGKSIGSVYAARSRVMRRLKQQVRELEETE